MVTAIAAGVLGLVGTALGTVLSMWVSDRSSARSERVARDNVVRHEFREAVVRFAAAVIAYRLAEVDRWHSQRGGWKDEKLAAEEVYRNRSAAWEALYILDLASDGAQFVELGRSALQRVYGIRVQDSKAGVNLVADSVMSDLEEFISYARQSKLLADGFKPVET